jgi:hypothetical protein
VIRPLRAATAGGTGRCSRRKSPAYQVARLHDVVT